MGISEILDTYPAERINSAAIECDFTATEIMDEIRRVRNNNKIPYAQRAQHIYNYILEASENILDCMHEEDQEDNACPHCGGSGGGLPPMSCSHCNGTGVSS